MPQNNVLHISFLWHMHQPYYKDLLENRFVLPWVRLHATKDYYDMVAYLDDFPKIHVNFNLVPSLIDQINDYAQNNLTDQFLDLTLKPASKLSPEERVFILQNFFTANWENMIKPFPRYWDLLSQRGKYVAAEELEGIQRRFSTQDFLDLQVLFNLCWIDPYLRRQDPELGKLEKKERRFTEEDKRLVIDKQLGIMKKIIGKYREKQEQGQIEISVTPYYHPILPLLIDVETAKMATPEIALPREEFRHQEDAKTQIELAVACHEKFFGRRPKGMWPAEGAVSEAIVPLISQAGIDWIATDEDILASSIGDSPHKADILYKPYRFSTDNSSLKIVFRNRKLSDLVGFTYARVPPDEAVRHFVQELHNIHKRVSHFPGPHLVTIILDGENCWEYYKNDGWDFLKGLYQAISDDPLLESTTIGKFIENYPEPVSLPRLWSGSWINRNFGVWIGHEEDNLSWDYLARTRKMLAHFEKRHPEKHQQEIQKAREGIYIAEGSDWNWWYGDEHRSANNVAFDNLYRKHLMNVYASLGQKVPDWLHITISGHEKPRPKREPADFINPILDGKVTDYFEWQGAGQYDVSETIGPMQRRGNIVRSFYYGFDLNNFHLRIDTNMELSYENLKDLTIKINFFKESPQQARIQMRQEGNFALSLFDIVQVEHREDYQKFKDLTSISYQKIIELSIPFVDLRAKVDQAIEIVVVLERNDVELERWPSHGTISFLVPGEDFSLQYWSV
ncbi:MAG: glycoside hydrolase family 57 protein [Elusimicrobiota bacterium]|nr:glycoside hydrolase family 57 protein [Elusimicrobiota bacterium]